MTIKLATIFTLILALALPTISFAEEFKMPEFIDGESIGKTDGNPVVVDDKPMWRLDQVWPSNPRSIANYVLLPWNGTQWAPEENHHGGQPSANVADGVCSLSTRAAWSGNTGNKLVSLAFVAPASGVYTIRAQVEANIWAGSTPVLFEVYKVNKESKKISRVFTVDLENNKKVPVEVDGVELEEGDELVFVPGYKAMHTAASFALSELVLATAAE